MIVHPHPAPPEQAIAEWLIAQSLSGTTLDTIVEGVGCRLCDLGITVARLHMSHTALHPRFESRSVTWRRGTGIDRQDHLHGTSSGEDWQLSPLKHLLDSGADSLRFRIEEGEGCDRFPLLADLRGQGMTDYLCFAVLFGRNGRIATPRTGMALSVQTDRPGGFTDADCALIARLTAPLAATARTSVVLATADTLAATYLGTDAGARVLDGEIRRGVPNIIDAAILYGDLRGFTRLTDTTPRDGLMAMLDDYLDAMAQPVETGGGQVLKFLGDGMLATFTLDPTDPADGCAAAIEAACAARDRVEALNDARRQAGMPVMSLDLALHRGEVLYGNVGSLTRLEFTVIGPAVNEAARIEALCADLDCPLLISQSFVAAAGTPDRFRSLGHYALRNVRGKRELFTLA